MELIFAFLHVDVSLTMGLTRCYKTGFFTFIQINGPTLTQM